MEKKYYLTFEQRSIFGGGSRKSKIELSSVLESEAIIEAQKIFTKLALKSKDAFNTDYNSLHIVPRNDIENYPCNIAIISEIKLDFLWKDWWIHTKLNNNLD